MAEMDVSHLFSKEMNNTPAAVTERRIKNNRKIVANLEKIEAGGGTVGEGAANVLKTLVRFAPFVRSRRGS
jgi:hypothetical protein